MLWNIVHDQCEPNVRASGRPSPCLKVDMSAGENRGFVLLKDRNGPEQVLLLPTARVTGMEDPALLAKDEPDWFALAWASRSEVERRLPRPVPDSDLSVAVNSVYGRSQDQLHLHIDCLTRASADALAGATVASGWTHVRLEGHDYLARRLPSGDRIGAIATLARTVPGARRHMGAWSVAVAGGPRGGLILLVHRADPAHGDFGSAEELQDHACALAAADDRPKALR